MKKFVISTALGLSVIGSSLAASAPASAFQLRNAQTDQCMGVAAGTPTAGTKYITWTCDYPRSANQNFSTMWDFNTPGGASSSRVTPGAIISLYNGVANQAVVDIAGTTPNNGTAAVLGYWGGQAKQTWTVDDSIGVRLNGRACYRFINRVKSSSGTQEALGVSGGSTQKGTPIITWQPFSNWYAHMDQFWCVQD